MPFHVQELADHCPNGKPWAVVNTVTGKIAGCYEDKDAATAAQHALKVSVPDSATRPKKGNAKAPSPLPPSQDVFGSGKDRG